MRISVDPASPQAPYEQVRAQFAAMMADGLLPAGTRLPTVRGLATELGLAVNTVARAYRELEEAGLVVTRGRHGSFVAPGAAGASAELVELTQGYAEAAHRLAVPPEAALGLVRAALGLAPDSPAAG